mgnify:CR=1 FL=1
MVRREAIPADFVDFMDYAVEMLDSPEEDDRSLVDLDDGLQWENGYGGRADGRFTFVFFPEGRDERWTIVLDEDSVDERDLEDLERLRQVVVRAELEPVDPF